MDSQDFGVKDIYQITIRTLDKMKFGDRQLSAGEPLFHLDQAQIVTLNQTASFAAARGGWENLPLVVWENNGDTTFQIRCGVVNETSFGALINAQILGPSKLSSTFIPIVDVFQLDNTGKGYLRYLSTPQKPTFFYTYKNHLQQQLTQPIGINGQIIDFGTDYANQTILGDYYYQYGDASMLYVISKDRMSGVFSLEAKYIRDGNIEGKRTSVLTMPRIKIISNLNMQIGNNARSPMLAAFNIIGLPQRTEYSDSSIVQILDLDDEII